MNLRLPFNGNYPITQLFGERITDPKGHTGIDYALPLGTPVLAAADGRVTTVGYDAKGYGNYVLITHGDGSQTLYGHLQTTTVKVDDYIYAGICVGQSGSTGYSTGPHLHFEYRINGKPVNPDPFLATSTTPSTPAVPANIDANGDGRVRVIVALANIRDDANGNLIGTLNNGTVIALTGDRKTANGLNWRKAELSFWIAEEDAFGTVMLRDE